MVFIITVAENSLKYLERNKNRVQVVKQRINNLPSFTITMSSNDIPFLIDSSPWVVRGFIHPKRWGDISSKYCQSAVFRGHVQHSLNPTRLEKFIRVQTLVIAHCLSCVDPCTDTEVFCLQRQFKRNNSHVKKSLLITYSKHFSSKK